MTWWQIITIIISMVVALVCWFIPDLHTVVPFMLLALSVWLGLLLVLPRNRNPASYLQVEQVLEQGSDGFMLLDHDWRFRYLNSAGERLLGRSRRELLGNDLWDEYVDTRGTIFEREYRRAMEQQTAVTFEAYYTPLEAWFEVSAYPIANGLAVYFRNINHHRRTQRDLEQAVSLRTSALEQEVIERRRAEKALRESEKRFRRLFELSIDAIVITDDLGNYTDVNAAAAEMFGFSRQQLLTMNVGQLRSATSMPTQEQFERYLARGQDRGEYRFIRADGEERTAEYTAVRLEANVHQSILRDITDLKRFEHNLLVSEERFRNAFNHAGIGMILVALDGLFLQVNPALCAIVGYEERELLRLHFQDITYPDDLAADLALLHRLVHGEITFYRIEKRYIRKDGSIVWIELIVSPVRDREGNVLQLVGQIQDISARRSAEEQLRASLAEKEILLKEIHHRVKNNLQVIASLLQLQSTSITDPYVRELFLESRRRVRAMSMVHERLYQSGNFGRVDAGEYVRRLADDLLRTYRGSMAGHVEMRVTCADVALDMDRAVIIGLLLNELIANSFKHAFVEREQGVITVTLRRAEERYLELIVSDDGVGMPVGLDPYHPRTMGLQVVDALCTQLRAKVCWETQPSTTIALRFSERGGEHD